MKADLTRNTFDHLKHYLRVLKQQGRVQLDSDWNEQIAILLHYLETLATDLIGPAGGPRQNYGFGISPLLPNAKSPIANDFRIGLGRYYVDGRLCEAEATAIKIGPASFKGTDATVQLDTWSLDGVEFQKNQFVELFDDDSAAKLAPTMAQITDTDKAHLTLTLSLDAKFDNPKNPKLRRVISFMTQPDYPLRENPSPGLYQVYLDVWERHLTWVEDDSIREVALEGPDTTTRTKLVWQVKLTSPVGTGCMSQQLLSNNFQPANRGRLKARAKQGSPLTDPCVIAPEASYTGPENQLYRVEIHTGGSLAAAPPPTFKWSRENGAVVFPIVSGGDTTEVVLENLGRDDRFGLAVGDWVEVQDDWSVLNNYAAHLLQVQAIDRTAMTVTLGGTPDKNVGGEAALHPLLRRWDQQAGDPDEGGLTMQADGAALILEGKWLTLEDGVQIMFQPPVVEKSRHVYRTGDYWLIPARIATGDVEWPRVMTPQGNPEVDDKGDPMPLPLPPEGIQHHYAPLALITLESGKLPVVGTDCREVFEPLAKRTE